MALKVGELYASFGIDSSGIGSAISGIEKKCSGIASSLTKTGAVLSATVTAPIIAFAKETYNIGTDFQAQMSRVQGISEATDTQLKQLTQTAKALGASSTFSASQAAEGMEYLASAGFKVDEIIAAMPGMLDLAASSGEDLGTSADIAASILRGFGMEASEAAHVADVLAKNAANTNAAVYDTGEAMKFVAPLANTMGLSFEEVTAAIGLMANAGIKGSQAGTTLRGALSRLAKPTKVMQETMDELGLSFYDSTGKMKSLPDMISMLQTSMSGLTEEQQQNALVTLFGQEALSGMMVLLEAGPEALAEMAAAYENCDGAASEMAEIMLNNLKGAMEGFNGAVETAQLNLYDRFAPAMTEAVQKATELVNSFNLLDDATKETVYKVVGLAAAAGPAMIGLGGVVGAVGKLLPLMGALISPLGIVTAGVALFGVAAVDAGNDIGKGFVKLSKSMKKSLSDINKNLSNQIKTVSKRIPALASSISEGLGEIMPVGMESAMTIITGFVSTIADNASDLAGIGLTIVNSIVDGVAAGLPKLLPAGAQMVTNIATSLISNLPNLLSALGVLAMSIWDSLNSVNWLELGGQIWNAITSAFKQTGDWVKHAVLGEKYTPEAGWDAVGAAIWESIKSGIKATGDWVKKAVLGDSYTTEAGWDVVGSAIWTSIKSGVKATGDWVKQLVLGETYTTEAGWDVVGSAIWTSIKSGIKATGDWLAALIMPEGTTFEAGTGWGTIGKSIWESIKSGISATGDWLAGLIMPANSTFTAGEGWKSIGKSVWTAIQGGISATGDWLATLVMPANTTFTAGAGWSTIGKAIWTAIQGGISATGDWVKELILGASYTADAGWSTVGSAIWTSIKSGISATGDWVKSLVLGSAYTADAGWNIVGSAIWGKITSGITATGDWVKGLVLGAEYTADAGWSTVGKAIWTKIQTGITATGDWIKGLILGNAFTADSDWTDVGEKIVSMISSGLKSLDFTAETMAANLTSLGNFVQTFVKNMLENKVDLGTSITTFVTNLVSEILTFNGWAALATTFGTIATSIINGIVTAIPTVTEGATSFISAIGSMLSSPATKEFLTAATNVATNIIDSIVKGIPKVVDGAKSIVGAIGDLIANVDWSKALDDVTKIGSAIMKAIVEGINGLGDVGSSVIEAVGNLLTRIDWTKITISLDGFADMLINGIVNGLKSIQEMVTELADALATAVSKIPWAKVGEAASSLATSLLDGIVAGLKTLTPGMDELINAISRGVNEALSGLATTASTIVGSLVGYLLNPANLAELASVGVQWVGEIVKGVLTLGAGLIETSADVLTNTIVGFFRGLFGIKVDPYIEQQMNDFLSADFVVSKRFDEFGGACGMALLQAMETSLITTDSLENAVEAWGIVVENGYAHLMPQFEHLGNEAIVNLHRSMIGELESGSGDVTAAIEQAALLAGLGFGETFGNALYMQDEVLGEKFYEFMESGFIDLSDLASKYGYDLGQLMGFSLPEGYTMAIIDGEPAIVQASQDAMDAGYEAVATGWNIDELMYGLWDHTFDTTFAEIEKWKPQLVTLLEGMGVEAGSLLGVALPAGVADGLKNGTLSVEEAAAAIAAAAIATEAQVNAANAANKAGGEKAGQGAADGTASAASDVEDASAKLVDAAETGVSGMPKVMTNASAEGTAGMQTGLYSSVPAVEVAAATVSSAAVEQFLKEMNFDSGNTIGKEFASGVQKGVSSQKAAVTAVMATVASSIKNTVSAIMSNSVGHGIGYQFSSGIAAGIRAGIGMIKSAAAAAAAAAVGGSQSELDINSPSRVAKKEVGWMYDEGIAVGLLDRIPIIRKAASDVAASMHDDFMVGDPSHGTVYSSGKTVRQAAKETAAQSSEDKSLLERARTMGIAIAEELINSGALDSDVYMDGEKTGRKTAAAVSRKINRDSKKTVSGRTGKAVFA